MPWCLTFCLALFLTSAGRSDEPNAVESGRKKAAIIQWVETDTGKWMVHDINRPAPPVVTPPGRYDDRPGTPSPDVNLLSTEMTFRVHSIPYGMGIGQEAGKGAVESGRRVF